ncbi:MAG: type IV pilus modification PilV family protein [Thermodesulfobacteriota bacterium]
MRYLQKLSKQSGITLVELIVSIVVIAVAVSGVLMAIQFTTRYSGDPMIRQQAVAIADAYMEEILLRSYEDPDGDDNESSRAKYDDVYDYNGIDEKPTDQTGSPMPGLENYQVAVGVENATDELGPNNDELNQSANVTVTVEHESADVEFTLNAFKAKY